MARSEDRRPDLVGEIIRQQRELAALPLRQLAALTGISNPYLSQIEHGLRAPSAAVMDSIARTLGIPVRILRPDADAVNEGAVNEGERENASASDVQPSLLESIRQDPALTSQQRRALAEIYTAMTEVTDSARERRR